MAERRSMTAAMTLTPEKLAFIQGQPSEPKQSDGPPAPSVSPKAAIESTRKGPGKSLAADAPRAAPPRKQTAARPKEPKTADETPFIDHLLVPLTTRLQPKTANALRRAYLEQKLKRAKPATQQEIVEAALFQWLQQHDYVD